MNTKECRLEAGGITKDVGCEVGDTRRPLKNVCTEKECRLEAGGTTKDDGYEAGDIKKQCQQACGLRIRHRGRLPHWELDGATYFVTFRLHDSISRTVADSYRFERANILKTAEQLKRALTCYEHERLALLYSEKIEQYLDRGIGNCFLGQQSVAQCVQDGIEYFHTQRYRLYSLCIMPNHVHVVFKPNEAYPLCEIVRSWKAYTARRANLFLNRSGAFWQREYYDHIVRDNIEFKRIIEYIANNPVKAGLTDWPWVRMYPD